jgi:hypothetical protein
MKVRIVKKKIDEDLFSNVKPNSMRKKPISPKKKRELEKRDDKSRARSTRRRKIKDDVFSASVGGVLEQILEQVIEELKLLEELDEAKISKTVPVCNQGSPWHDSLGRFSTKKNAKSWSIRTDKKKDGKCSKGQNKTDGSGKRSFTRVRCGRQDHKDSDSPKAKWRCKDGARVNEGEKDEFVKIRKDAFQALLTELDVEPDLLDENDENIKACNARGLFTIKQFLQHIDNLERARDGKLREPT